jgi:hypothetical protein
MPSHFNWTLPQRAKPCGGYFELVPSGVTDQLVSLHSTALQSGGRVIHGSCHILRSSHILRLFLLFWKGGNLTVSFFNLHFRYSHRPISFCRSKSRRLVPPRFTSVPGWLDSSVPVRSEGRWSSVYEKQTRLPAQRNHLSIQCYTNSNKFSTLLKSKYTNMISISIYLLTAVGLTPVAAVQNTFTHKQYTEKHKNLGRVRAVPCLCELYPGICLTTEEKARKNLSQGSRRVLAGTMKTEYT